jgi:uncharacterized membrane protein
MSNSIGQTRQSGRDYGIDGLRGLAIVAMVASHLAREVLVEPHPMWLRVYGSLAAPLFITLAGMLIAQTSAKKHHPLSYYVERGLIILGLAAAVDVLLWGIYPFVGCDVLYLIGLAMPLTALFGRLRPAWQSGILVLILGLSGMLRHLFGYPEHVLNIALTDPTSELSGELPTILHQWIISGWFPALPWLFFSFLGVRLFQWRQAPSGSFALHVSRVAAGLASLGAVCLWIVPTPIYERGGYSELFYPPTAAFVLVASGGVLLLFALSRHHWLQNSRPLILLGQCSLLMYIVHLAIIHWGVGTLLEDIELPLFLLVYAALLLVLVALAEVVEIYKRRSERPLPFMLRLLLGG